MKKKTTLNTTKNKVHQVVCSRCDNTTNHIVLGSAEFSWNNDDIQGSENHEIIQCSGCDSISFRIASSTSDEFEMDDKGEYFLLETEQIYPSRLMGRTALVDIYSVPDKVRSIYRETHAALCTKLNILAGIGIRALVESVCIEESTSGKNLLERIDDLVKKGVLTKRNAEVLHKTRLLGNRSAHDLESPPDSELDVAFDIVENLLETVYVIPKKAERLKK